MPTGYTSEVQTGEVTDLRTFIERCAHAFIVSLRDSRMDSPLPTEDTYSASSYHTESLERAYKSLALAKSLNRQQASEQARKEHREEIKRYKELVAKQAVEQERYEAMLEQVYTWQPPTDNHVGLKKFMVEQLSGSIEFDCASTLWQDELDKAERLGPLTGDEWKKKQIEQANHDIEYHTEEMTKDRERQETNTAWIQALIKSLPETEPVQV